MVEIRQTTKVQSVDGLRFVLVPDHDRPNPKIKRVTVEFEATPNENKWREGSLVDVRLS